MDLGAYESCQVAPFRRGDPGGDGSRDLTDVVFILDHLFTGGPPSPCLKSEDVDDGGTINLTDPIHLVVHLFLGGPPPAPPLACGSDPTPDGLACEFYPGCP